MRPVFRATTPEDAENLGAFLSRSLNVRPDHPLLSAPCLHWKYWQERPDCNLPRSYVAERDGRILAHGAAWPVHINTEPRLAGFHLFDWAADAGSPGMGAAILQKMRSLADLVWVAGGSPDARRMRVATGFREVAVIFIYALPLRPARMEWTREKHDWKTPARWMRNARSRWQLAGPDNGWQAVACTNPERLNVPAPRTIGFHSSLEFARYYAACPVARMQWYEVRRDGNYSGFFLLAHTPGQVRLAEAALTNPGDSEAWRNLAGLAARAALESAGANEIAVWTTHRGFSAALSRVGYLPRGQEALMLLDPAGKLPSAELHFQLLHGDMAFLHNGRPQYLC